MQATHAYRLWLLPLWIVLLLFYLQLPPNADGFTFDYMGWRVASGDVPYRDFFMMDWPGVIWMHALSVSLFGNTIWSYRVIDFAFLLLSTAALADVASRSASARAGTLVLALYPLVYIGLNGMAGTHDMGGTHFLVGVVWAYYRGQTGSSNAFYALAGALLTCASLCKPTLVVVGPLLLLTSWFTGTSWRRVMVDGALALLGGLAVFVGAFGTLVWQGASVSNLVDCLITFNLTTQFVLTATIGQLFLGAAQVLLHYWPVFTACWLMALVGDWRTGTRFPAAIGLTTLTLGGLLSVYLQHQGFPYHFAPLAPAAIGILAVTLPNASTGRLRHLQTIGLATILLLTLAKFSSTYWSVPLAIVRGDQAVHLKRFDDRTLTLAETTAISGRIAAELPANQEMYVAGNNYSLNFLSRHRQPTRIFDWQVILKTTSVVPFADRWIANWRSDLEGAHPYWILVEEKVESTLDTDPLPACGVLKKILAADYERRGPFDPRGLYVLYVRKSPGGHDLR